MTTYKIITNNNSNELTHYGVLGMKWGVRNSIKVHSNVRKAKTLKEKASESFGSGYQRTSFNTLTRKYSAKAAKSKTKLGKKYNSRMAYNNAQAAKMWDKINTSNLSNKSVPRKVKDAITTIGNTKYKRAISGRTTTVGERVIDNILTGGTYGIYKDLQYMKNNKKSKNT